MWWKQDILLALSPAVPLAHTAHAACRNSWAQEICWGTGFRTHFSSDSCLACLWHVNKSLNIEQGPNLIRSFLPALKWSVSHYCTEAMWAANESGLGHSVRTCTCLTVWMHSGLAWVKDTKTRQQGECIWWNRRKAAIHLMMRLIELSNMTMNILAWLYFYVPVDGCMKQHCLISQ